MSQLFLLCRNCLDQAVF